MVAQINLLLTKSSKFFWTGTSSRASGGNTFCSCRGFVIYEIPIGRPFCSVLTLLPAMRTRATFPLVVEGTQNFATPCSRPHFLEQEAHFNGCISCLYSWPWAHILRGDSEGSMPLSFINFRSRYLLISGTALWAWHNFSPVLIASTLRNSPLDIRFISTEWVD